MRTLHVIEPWWSGAREGDCGPSDAAVVCCAAMRAGGAGGAVGAVGDAVCVIGPGEARARARSLGLEVDATILPVLGRGSPRGGALRRVVDKLGGFDVVRAWTRGAVATGLSSGVRLVDSSGLEESEACAERWAKGAALRSRERAREEMGLADDLVVVGLIADPPSDGDASDFVYFKMLVAKAGVASVTVVQRGAWQLDRARGFHRELSHEGGFLAWNGAMLPLMAAFDGVVLSPPTARSDSLRGARARVAAIVAARAGVPMVCAAGDGVSAMAGVTASKDSTRSSLATALMAMLGAASEVQHG